MKISFGGQETCLGDVLATIYCLENLGRQTGHFSEIHGQSFMDVFKLFDLQWLRILPNSKGMLRILDHLVSFPNEPDDCHHWIVLLQNWLSETYPDFDQSLSSPLNPSFPVSHEKSNVTLVQFDGRTARRKGRSMRPAEMKIAVRRWAESKVVSVIGGPETIRYLGDETSYLLGDVKFQINWMLRCQHFLGIDSGMSHLAGVLGVRSKVIVLHGQDCIPRFYQTLYRHTTCYDRNQLPGKLFI